MFARFFEEIKWSQNHEANDNSDGVRAALRRFALGQTVTLVDSLPSAQGWSFLNTCAKPESSLFSVANNVLHQDTDGLRYQRRLSR